MPLKSFLVIIIVLSVSLILVSPSFSLPDAGVKYSIIRQENPLEEKEVLIIPYIFPSDYMGTTSGIGGMTRGYGQKQLRFGATAFTSKDGAGGGIAGIWDYKLKWFDRLYFSAILAAGHYPRQRAYTQGNRTGNEKEAGGNDSSKNDYIEDQGLDNWFELKLEYVLPIGSMKNKSYAIIVLDASGKVLFVKDGPLSEIEIESTIELIENQMTYGVLRRQNFKLTRRPVSSSAIATSALLAGQIFAAVSTGRHPRLWLVRPDSDCCACECGPSGQRSRVRSSLPSR